MSRYSKIEQKQRATLESEFSSLLAQCLQESANGRWGLFGQNELLDPGSKFLNWPEAARLREIAQRIHSVRLSFGVPNEVCERFLHFCSLRGSNISGEPKLARTLLDELAPLPPGPISGPRS